MFFFGDGTNWTCHSLESVPALLLARARYLPICLGPQFRNWSIQLWPSSSHSEKEEKRQVIMIVCWLFKVLLKWLKCNHFYTTQFCSEIKQFFFQLFSIFFFLPMDMFSLDLRRLSSLKKSNRGSGWPSTLHTKVTVSPSWMATLISCSIWILGATISDGKEAENVIEVGPILIKITQCHFLDRTFLQN